MTESSTGKSFSRSRLAGRASVWVIFAIAMMFSTGGCAALTLATLGTIAGSAGSAISTGREVYELGKLDAAEMARFDQAVLAAQQAADDLGLQFKPYPKGKPSDQSIMVLPFVDERGSRVKVRLERRAERLVLIRVDVGWFGSEVTAHLFLTRLRSHLPRPPGKRPSPEEWESPE
jgi:hypothetical protein